MLLFCAWVVPWHQANSLGPPCSLRAADKLRAYFAQFGDVEDVVSSACLCIWSCGCSLPDKTQPGG